MEDTLGKLKKELIESKIDEEGNKLFNQALSQYIDIIKMTDSSEYCITELAIKFSKFENKEKMSALIDTLIHKEISHPILKNTNLISNKEINRIIEILREEFFDCLQNEGDYATLCKKLEKLKGTVFFVPRFFYYSYVIINYKIWTSIHGIVEMIEPSTFEIDSYTIKSSLLEFYKLKELNEGDFKKFTPKGTNYIFRFGKYKGMMLKNVMEAYPSYIIWQILNNITFSVSYGVLHKILLNNTSTQVDLLIFLTTIKNEFANKDSSLYYDDFPHYIKADMFDDSEEVQGYYDEAAYDFLTGGDDYDEFNGDWDKLGDNIGQ